MGSAGLRSVLIAIDPIADFAEQLASSCEMITATGVHMRNRGTPFGHLFALLH